FNLFDDQCQLPPCTESFRRRHWRRAVPTDKTKRGTDRSGYWLYRQAEPRVPDLRGRNIGRPECRGEKCYRHLGELSVLEGVSPAQSHISGLATGGEFLATARKWVCSIEWHHRT